MNVRIVMPATFTTHSHQHHLQDACSPPEAVPFPPAAENALLRISRIAARGKLPLTAFADMPARTPQQPCDVTTAARQRLGKIYPVLSATQEAAVAYIFSKQWPQLPQTHARYDHGHQHDHDDHCSKAHGPLRKRIHNLERAVLRRIPHDKARILAALAFRGTALLFCPGDDIAAIGLQLYSAFGGSSGHTHIHDEPKATLPRRPRIDFEYNNAIISLPIDAAVPHASLPDTPSAHMLRDHTNDPGQLPQPETAL